MGEADMDVEDLDRMLSQYLKTTLRANGVAGFVLRRDEALDVVLCEYAFDSAEEVEARLTAMLRAFFENPAAWLRDRSEENEWLVERAERVAYTSDLAHRVQVYAASIAEEHEESGGTISGTPPPDSPPIPADDLLQRHLERLGLAKKKDE